MRCGEPPGRLDDDDVGAEVGEQLAGPGDVLVGQLDDAATPSSGPHQITPSSASRPISAVDSPSTSESTRSLSSPSTGPPRSTASRSPTGAPAARRRGARRAWCGDGRPQAPRLVVGVVVAALRRPGARARAGTPAARTAATTSSRCRAPASTPPARRRARPGRPGARRASPARRPSPTARRRRRRGRAQSSSWRQAMATQRVVVAARVDAVRAPSPATVLRFEFTAPSPRRSRPLTVASSDRRPGQRDAGLDAGQVDPLALARAALVVQRGEQGDGHDVAAGVVHVRVAPAGRLLVGQARTCGSGPTPPGRSVPTT